MVKKVFVFSDMEFDQASSRPLETDYEAVTKKFFRGRLLQRHSRDCILEPA